MLLDSSGFCRTLHISFFWNLLATAYLLTELTFLWPLNWQMRLESMLACTKFVIIVFITEWLVCLPRNPAATHMRFMVDPSVSWPIGWLRYYWDDMPFLLIPKKNGESLCDMFWGLLVLWSLYILTGHLEGSARVGNILGAKGLGSLFPVRVLVSRSVNSKNSVFASSRNFRSPHCNCLASWEHLNPSSLVTKYHRVNLHRLRAVSAQLPCQPQTVLLLGIQWLRTNWAVAYPGLFELPTSYFKHFLACMEHWTLYNIISITYGL